MKKILFFSTMLLVSVSSFSQGVAINTSNAIPDSSAILDISSYTKGVLIPRLRTNERQSISGPAEGLLVYDINTYSFWFFRLGAWKEILKEGDPILPIGPAGGDLSGSYPTPSVVKIQNLDVSADFPLDKTVLKWDALSNNWKGRNDSLFLPYNVTYGSPTKLFGVTNANTTGGSAAVFGRSGTTQSGINPGFTMGVWGDNANGQGVAGTSNAGNGVFGSSILNHGVVGYSGNSDFAGVYGSHTEFNGIGVLGEVEENAIALVGRSIGTQGRAALIEMTSTVNPNAALGITHQGLGRGVDVNMTASNSFSNAINITSAGSGYGVNAVSELGGAARFAIENELNATGHALDVYTEGLSNAMTIQTINPLATSLMMSGANYGLGSGLYLGMYNNDNNGNGLEIVHNGTGTTGYFYKNNTTGSISDVHKPAVYIENKSKGNALKVISLHAPSVSSGIDVQYGGDAFGININAGKNGLHAFTSDPNGTSIIGENYQGGYAVKAYNNASQRGAVYAESSHMFGRGIEAVTTGSQSHAIVGTSSSAADAILGINNADSGSGVTGRTNAPSVGIGILGESTSTSWGIPAHFVSNCPDAQTNTLWIRDFSKGQTIRVQVENPANNKEAFYIRHDGTGKLASLNNTDTEAFSVSNGGNTMAKGTMTVKGNKGIIRNSTATQMRMETASVQLIYFNMPVGGYATASVSFSTAFSSPPVVSVGNIQSGFTGPCDKMTVQIKDVTTTGCTVTLYNPGVSGDPNVSGTWNLVVIGAE